MSKPERNFKKGFNIPFTQVPNEILYRPDVSMKAKGIWAYMNAKPDGWFFAADRIADECTDGRDSIRTGLKELLQAGLLSAKKQPNGRFVYTLKIGSFPQDENSFPQTKDGKSVLGYDPKTENPTLGKSQSGKIRPIINKEDNKERIKEIEAGLAGKEPASLTRNQILEMEYNGEI